MDPIYGAFAFTTSNPLARNSINMLLANWEHSWGMIQDGARQSGSSSLG